MVSSIGSSFATDTSSAAQKSADLFSSNSTTYLQLFLAQLKHQDPTQPFEVKDMTEQLSQLTNSQQLIQLNKNIENLTTLQNNSTASNLASFINKKVEYKGSDFTFDGKYVSEINYELNDTFKKTNIEISDSSGKIIYRTEGEKKAGSYKFVWSGETTSGTVAPAGKYSIKINGLDSNSVYKPQTTLLFGNVTGIDYASSAEPQLMIGSGQSTISVGMNNVASVLSAY